MTEFEQLTLNRLEQIYSKQEEICTKQNTMNEDIKVAQAYGKVNWDKTQEQEKKLSKLEAFKNTTTAIFSTIILIIGGFLTALWNHIINPK